MDQSVYDIFKIILGVLIPAAMFYLGALIKKKWERLDEAIKMIVPNGGTAIPDKIDNIQTGISSLAAESKAALYINPQPLFKTDERGRCTFVNSAYTEATGLAERECYGTGWTRAIHKDDKERVKNEWEAAILSRTEFSVLFSWVNQKTGFNHEASCKATIIKHKKTNMVIGSIGMIEILSTNDPSHPKYVGKN